MSGNPGYPRQDGGNTLIGPECFASGDGSVISWKGENYYRREDGEPAPELAAAITETRALRALIAEILSAMGPAGSAQGRAQVARWRDRAGLTRDGQP